MNENKLMKAMRICSQQVRRTKCVNCLHFQECVRRREIASPLGAFVSWLQLTALPAIEGEVNKHTPHHIELEAHAPNRSEEGRGAYGVVRVYKNRENRKQLFRIFLTGFEDTQDVCNLIVNKLEERKDK